jgi:putative iron-dependent peroxidase
MFVGRPPGNYDRILDFSTAVSGSLFFVPTVDFLDDPPDPGASVASVGVDVPVGEDDGVPAGADDHGSLGIGALR